MIRSNCIQFFQYNVDIKTQVNRNSTTSTFLFVWFIQSKLLKQLKKTKKTNVNL
jgi:hypothetical protein